MDLRELYQEVILDHGKHPRNHRFPEAHNREGRGYNPLCGYKITLRLQLDGDTISVVATRPERLDEVFDRGGIGEFHQASRLTLQRRTL